MDSSEEQRSEEPVQPTVSTPAASQGNVGAGNGGGGSQEAILTMRHFQQMMATVSNLSQQNVVALQQQLLEMANANKESSGKAVVNHINAEYNDPVKGHHRALPLQDDGEVTPEKPRGGILD